MMCMEGTWCFWWEFVESRSLCVCWLWNGCSFRSIYGKFIWHLIFEASVSVQSMLEPNTENSHKAKVAHALSATKASIYRNYLLHTFIPWNGIRLGVSLCLAFEIISSHTHTPDQLMTLRIHMLATVDARTWKQIQFIFSRFHTHTYPPHTLHIDRGGIFYSSSC